MPLKSFRVWVATGIGIDCILDPNTDVATDAMNR